MKKKLYRLIFFFLALGLLFWLLNYIGWDKIGNAFAKVGYSGALILLALGMTENIFDAIAYRFAIRGKIGLFRLLSYNGAGAIVNVLIPWEAGEVVKAALFKQHVSTSEAISGTVLWNYIFKITRPMAALIAVAVAWIVGHDASSYVTTIITLASVAAFLPYFVMRILLRIGVAGMTARFLSWLRIFRKDPERMIAAARELDTSLKRFWKERPADFVMVLTCQLTARLAAWICWTATIWLVGLDYSFGLCAMIFAGLSIANYIVMLGPAKLGVGEGAGYLLFQIMGLDAGMGLIIFLIMRLKALITNGAAGLAVFVLPKPRTPVKTPDQIEQS